MPSGQAFDCVLGVHTSSLLNLGATTALVGSEHCGRRAQPCTVLALCVSVGCLLFCWYLIYVPVPQCTAYCISGRKNSTAPNFLSIGRDHRSGPGAIVRVSTAFVFSEGMEIVIECLQLEERTVPPAVICRGIIICTLPLVLGQFLLSYESLPEEECSATKRRRFTMHDGSFPSERKRSAGIAAVRELEKCEEGRARSTVSDPRRICWAG